MVFSGVLAALLAITLGCTGRPTAPPSSRPQASASPTAVDIAPACRHPNAIASTNRHFQVGEPGAPTVGPLSFHPYPYQAGYPTKMIIHVVHDVPQPVVLRGYRCTDGRVLRFNYTRDPSTLPTPPYTAQQLQELGDLVATLRPVPAGADTGGYALFSSAGQWLVTLARSGTIVGVLRIDVEPWCGRLLCDGSTITARTDSTRRASGRVAAVADVGRRKGGGCGARKSGSAA